MLPPAPGRLSATTATPRSFAISSAMSRVRKSPEPPGGKPTTMRIGLAGNACANAEPQKRQRSSTRSTRALSRALCYRRRSTSGAAVVVPPAEEAPGLAATGELLVPAMDELLVPAGDELLVPATGELLVPVSDELLVLVNGEALVMPAVLLLVLRSWPWSTPGIGKAA